MRVWEHLGYLILNVPTDRKMTKSELLGHNENGKKLTSSEIFETSVSSLRQSINRCATGIRCSVWNSVVFGYHQRRKLEQFCDIAENLMREMKKWKYFQEKNENSLDLFK